MIIVLLSASTRSGFHSPDTVLSSVSMLVTSLALVLLDGLLGELTVDFLARVDDLVDERALEGLESALGLMRVRLLYSWFGQRGQIRLIFSIHIALVDCFELLFLHAITS